MTRTEAERLTRQADTLRTLGFTLEEAEQIRRISMALRRWHEHECNGTIQREGDGAGRPYWHSTYDGRRLGPAADREAGALRRLGAIINARNARVQDAEIRPDTGRKPVTFYVQGDPRGCALYILRPGDVPDGADAGSYYDRGIAVY